MTASPTILGDYEIERELGRGGMATVYLAQRRGPQGFRKRVALKVIRSELAGDASFRAMFVDEAKIAQSLHHGNIVQLYELGEAQGQYYISMEYVRGKNLLQVLETQPDRLLPAPLALYITRCLCRALHYAHEKHDDRGTPLGIIHRDVSPQNVLLADDGQVKLADFGIARAFDRLGGRSLPGTVKGKAGYLSPEQARGKATIDQRSDLFSLGIVTYLMLTGTNPLAADDIHDSLRKTLAADIPPLSETSRSVDDRLTPLVAGAVAREPEDRYTSAQQWLTLLEELRFAQSDTTDSAELAAFLQQSGLVGVLPPRRSLDDALERVLGETPSDIRNSDGAASSETTATSMEVPGFSGEPPIQQRRHLPALLWGALAVACMIGVALLLLSPASGPLEDVAEQKSDRSARPPDQQVIVKRPTTDAPPSTTKRDPDASQPRTNGATRVRARKATGELWVNLIPWARVMVDGRLVGDTPQQLKLPVGRHRVVLSNPSVSLRRELTVRITASQTVRIEKW